MPQAMRMREHAIRPVRLALKRKRLADYERFAGRDALDEIRDLSRALRGLRVLEVNSTAFGGGVAELLSSVVPLLANVGLRPEWVTLPSHVDFFEVTKRFHNALQGKPYSPPDKDVEMFLDHDRLSAEALDVDYDLIVTHDPQPVALRHFARESAAKWVWRCHIDTSSPSSGAWDLLRPFVREHDAAVFTMPEFVPPHLGMPVERLFFIPPAIDPLAAKNRRLPKTLYEEVVSELGIDIRRPLIVQVSRFDPWKDPFGVVRVYRRLKERFDGLQLAFVGSMAKDDPEAWDIYSALEDELAGEKDTCLFTNLGALEVNCFQHAADVVIQKSVREGFGLVVSEALWKETPVLAGRTGGIPLQLSDGVGGFLASSADEFVERASWLLEHRAEARKIARAGTDHVRRHFLVTRLLADELRLFREVIG